MSTLVEQAALWQSCAEAYIAHIYEISHSKASLRNYRGIISSFMTNHPVPGVVTRRDIEAFVSRPNSKRGKGQPAAATRKFRLCALSSFYQFASSYPVSDDQPLFQRANPTISVAKSKPGRVRRTISEEDLRRLFAVIPTDTLQGLRDRAFYLTLFFTCRRREEIARLRWSDIEQATIVDENGRTHEGYLYRYRGKGHSEQDSVAELPTPAYDAIHRYLVASGRLATMQPDSPLFIAVGREHGERLLDPMKPMSSSTAASHLKHYLALAGLDPHISLHWFRHAATQQRHRQGQSIYSLKKLLNHSSIATTELYVGLLDGTADEGAAQMAAKFGNL